MRAAILTCLIALCCFITSCKKEELYWQKIVNLESHTTSRLNRIAYINNNTCIIGGGEKYEKAEVLASYDGGNTWEVKSFPEAGKGMYGLGISPNGNTYLSGFDGKIVYSRDGGENWNTGQVPNWKYYIAIAYPGNDTGFYVATSALNKGNIVRVDSNFGIIDTTGYDFALNDIAFPSKKTGYVTGYGAVLKTSDRGATWHILDVKNDNFKAVYCIDEDNTWICGYNGSICHSTDGGATWERLRNGNSIAKPRYRLNDITFKDKDHGWAVGENGLIISTIDGGQTWKEYNKFTDVHFLCVAVTPDGNILVAGEHGALYKLYV